MPECKHPCCGDICRKKKPPKPKTPIRRNSKPIAKVSKKKRSTAPKAGKTGMAAFFDEMMAINDPCCENCGSYKPHLKAPYYKFLWKSCQAHILPKRHFKSIETNPLNILVLGSGISGMCFCHDDYDHSWDKASKMRVWPIVVERFKLLSPLIAPEEYKFIPEILLSTLQ